LKSWAPRGARLLLGAAGRLGANAIDKLGPFGTLPYDNVARSTRQFGRIDSNPFSPPAQR